MIWYVSYISVKPLKCFKEWEQRALPCCRQDECGSLEASEQTATVSGRELSCYFSLPMGTQGAWHQVPARFFPTMCSSTAAPGQSSLNRQWEEVGQWPWQPLRCRPHLFSLPSGWYWQETEENKTKGFDYLLKAAGAGDRQSMILVARAFDTGQNLSPDRYCGHHSGRAGGNYFWVLGSTPHYLPGLRLFTM